MARVYKIETYIVDTCNDYKNAKSFMNRMMDRTDCFMVNPHYQTSKEFEWDDDIDLNYNDCTEEQCEKYFK